MSSSLDDASFTLLVKGVAVKLAFLLGSGGTPEVEVQLGAVGEDVGFALVGVREPVHLGVQTYVEHWSIACQRIHLKTVLY